MSNHYREANQKYIEGAAEVLENLHMHVFDMDFGVTMSAARILGECESYVLIMRRYGFFDREEAREDYNRIKSIEKSAAKTLGGLVPQTEVSA